MLCPALNQMSTVLIYMLTYVYILHLEAPGGNLAMLLYQLVHYCSYLNKDWMDSDVSSSNMIRSNFQFECCHSFSFDLLLGLSNFLVTTTTCYCLFDIAQCMRHFVQYIISCWLHQSNPFHLWISDVDEIEDTVWKGLFIHELIIVGGSKNKLTSNFELTWLTF